MVRNQVSIDQFSQNRPFHSQVQKVRSPNLLKDKCMSDVVRIGSIIIFQLSKLWKATFSILWNVIFLARLQATCQWYWLLLGVKGNLSFQQHHCFFYLVNVGHSIMRRYNSVRLDYRLCNDSVDPAAVSWCRDSRGGIWRRSHCDVIPSWGGCLVANEVNLCRRCSRRTASSRRWTWGYKRNEALREMSKCGSICYNVIKIGETERAGELWNSVTNEKALSWPTKNFLSGQNYREFLLYQRPGFLIFLSGRVHSAVAKFSFLLQKDRFSFVAWHLRLCGNIGMVFRNQKHLKCVFCLFWISAWFPW